MTEPTTLVVPGVLASIAAGFLQLMGIDMIPVIWGSIGAIFAQGYSDLPITRTRACIHIFGSGLLGGLMGTVFAAFSPDFRTLDPRHLVLVLAAVCGFGCQPIMQAILSKLLHKLTGDQQP